MNVTKIAFKGVRSLIILTTCTLLFAEFYTDEDANHFNIINQIKPFPKIERKKTKGMTIEGVELGRRLFYDPVLSKDSTMACSTCHQQKYAFGYTTNYLIEPRINQLITTREVLPIFNLAWNETFFWDGRETDLINQAYHPVRNPLEMNNNWSIVTSRIRKNASYKRLFYKAFKDTIIDSARIARAISYFELTLVSNNSKFDKYLRGEVELTQDELKGLDLIKLGGKGNCLQCHTLTYKNIVNDGLSKNGLLTDEEILKGHDNGKANLSRIENDKGRFKVPSLRNLSFTAPYMHDGRLLSLDFVINHYASGINKATSDKLINKTFNNLRNISNEEKRQIICILNALNDSVFITDRRYSKPQN